MKIHHIIYSTLTLLALLAFSSCSETDDTVEEFADWQTKNETYFSNIYQQALDSINAGNTSWKIVKSYSLPDYNASFTAQPTHNIVVKVIDSVATSTEHPLYTDSVNVNYVGRLIPSPSYPKGYVFDRTYTGTLDRSTALPSGLKVNNLIDGFATALMNMSVGDRWLVYIPYQLGYGTSTSNTSIPAYSTLIFDIDLVSFSRPKK